MLIPFKFEKCVSSVGLHQTSFLRWCKESVPGNRELLERSLQGERWILLLSLETTLCLKAEFAGHSISKLSARRRAVEQVSEP
jgi:hypothetical protein